MRVSERLCNDLASAVGTVYEKVSERNKQNLSAVDSLFELDSCVFVSLAKLDHVIWKVKTYLSVLEDKEKLSFVSHKDCRLGNWYYEGDGYDAFSNLPEYALLEEPHIMVHQGTKEILEYINNPQGVEKLKAALNTMEVGSRGVFDVLDQLILNHSRT